MKNKILYLIILSLITFSCNTKVDYTNPSDVVLKYRELRNSNKIKESFELIADTCKSILTLQEYLDSYKIEDTIKGKLQFEIKVIQLPINIKYPTFRIFEVTQQTINSITKDSSLDIYYYTTVNENNKWKILWTNHIEKAAGKLEKEQKFEEANEILLNTFKYNPMNGYVYYYLGRNYYRLNELEESNLYAKKAIEFSPKNSYNYSLQAAIFISKDMNELAIENYQIALNLCTDADERSSVYGSMGNIYLELNQLSKSKDYLLQAVSLNSNYSYNYWMLANLFVKSVNKDSALFYFDKAVNSKPMESYLQQQLYYDYANELFKSHKNTDKIREAFYALKDTELFLDEQDFRENVTKDPKGTFEGLNLYRKTKGLFLDFEDFETKLGLKKNLELNKNLVKNRTQNSNITNAKSLEKAKDLLIKAINLNPEDEDYKKLFKEIKDEIK
jgi:tetratricopeptide (TPR) repeat protein